MIILDSIMDALTSVLPGLTRTPAAGNVPGAQGGKGVQEGMGSDGNSAFAAALHAILGKGPQAKATPGTPEMPVSFLGSGEAGNEPGGIESQTDAPFPGEGEAVPEGLVQGQDLPNGENGENRIGPRPGTSMESSDSGLHPESQALMDVRGAGSEADLPSAESREKGDPTATGPMERNPVPASTPHASASSSAPATSDAPAALRTLVRPDAEMASDHPVPPSPDAGLRVSESAPDQGSARVSGERAERVEFEDASPRPRPVATDLEASAEGQTDPEADGILTRTVSPQPLRSNAPEIRVEAAPVATGIDVSAAGSVEPRAEVSPVESVSRDLGRLQPEFRQRLERVMERMAEQGHAVKVVEGYRSPQRQEALYEQGRTEAGPVVTWTRESLHSQGRAADLQVDGSWENPQGYARLQQVAREEGLQTLGARDPGHLELSEEGAKAPLNETGNRRAGSRISRPARVAQVARVARPARPGVAQTRRPVSGEFRIPAEGQPSPQSSPRVTLPEGADSEVAGHSQADPEIQAAPGSRLAQARRMNTDLPEEARVATVAPVNREERSARPTSGDRESGNGGVSSLSREAGQEGTGSAQTLVSGSTQPVGRVEATEAIQRPGSVERVQNIRNLEEALNAQAPSRIHLDLENADGAGTRLRLALNGARLAGSVDLADPLAADRMRARVGELHEALSRRGLDSQALGIQSIRGVEAAAGSGSDMTSLINDPLAALTRVMEAREGATENRSDRNGHTRDENQRQAGGFKSPTRQDRNKENRR